ncbi:MAG: hypothetical protein ABIN58_08405, partial [candidate division WOR-3 bacterium]
MLMRVVMFFIGLFLLFGGVAFSQGTTPVEKRLTELLRQEYGRTGVHVNLDGISSPAKQASRIRSIHIHRAPDVSGKG